MGEPGPGLVVDCGAGPEPRLPWVGGPGSRAERGCCWRSGETGPHACRRGRPRGRGAVGLSFPELRVTPGVLMAAVGRCSFTIEAPAHQTRGKPASPRHAGSRNLESQILGLRLSRAGPAALRAVAGFWATTACPAHADSSRAASPSRGLSWSRRLSLRPAAARPTSSRWRPGRQPLGPRSVAPAVPHRRDPQVGISTGPVAVPKATVAGQSPGGQTPDLPPCSGRLPGLGAGPRSQQPRVPEGLRGHRPARPFPPLSPRPPPGAGAPPS